MQSESYLLLNNVSTESNEFLFSDKNQGAGYHNLLDNLHTVQFSFDQFVGTCKIQGTLSLYPSDNDWVDINPDTVTITVDDSTSLTSSETRNFSGNFIWIRAAYRIEQGTITEIRYNL